jgi:hypothetical protein
MSEDELRYRSVSLRAARASVQEAAWILGCGAEDVPELTRVRLLKPLGNPTANSRKYYSTKELMKLAEDQTFLSKMTNTLYRKWRDKNASRTENVKITAPHFVSEYEENSIAGPKR